LAEETPLDRFKQALTGTARAMSDVAEVEVNWSADVPAISGTTMRVPMPGRGLPLEAAMQARGVADGYALRIKHHNAALHNRAQPAEATARACFDAIEQVRYEALGANEYDGVRYNLGVALQQRIAGDPITRVERPDQVPLPTALSLILREHLTGEPVPEAAERGVSMVRNWIEQKAGKDFEALAEKLEDQKAFQHLALDMLGHLELTRAELEPNGEDEETPSRRRAG
jgi:cobaltochelatase CobT